MKDPSAITDEIKAAKDRAKQLKEKQKAAFGELILKTGADKLPFEVLAGLLIAGVETAEKDPGEAERWRLAGAEFFRTKATRRKRAKPSGAAQGAASDGSRDPSHGPQTGPA